MLEIPRFRFLNLFRQTIPTIPISAIAAVEPGSGIAAEEPDKLTTRKPIALSDEFGFPIPRFDEDIWLALRYQTPPREAPSQSC